MEKNNFFGIFKDKFNQKNIQIISDIYKDNDIATLYDGDILNDEEFNFYFSNLNKEDKIIEIGTGNGRIITPLLNKSLDIYGIEPSLKMINKIFPLENRERVFNITLEEFINNSKKTYNKILIPATSISLFSPTSIRHFIDNYIQNISFDSFQILFDFLNESFFKEIDSKIEKNSINDTRIYSANYLKGKNVFFNIYLKSKTFEKIGYSKKFIYSEKVIHEIMNNKKYDLKIFNTSHLSRAILTIYK